MSTRRTPLKAILPVAVLLLTGGIVVALIRTRPRVRKRPREIQPPVVRVERVEFKNVTLTVRTQGIVQPRTASVLVSEVSGRVVWVSPALRPGGFFSAGQRLLRIDPRDYQDALVRVEAAGIRAQAHRERAVSGVAQAIAQVKQGELQIAQAEQQLVRERLGLQQAEAEASAARREWQQVGKWRGHRGAKPDPLVLREPQRAEARAGVAVAIASLAAARAELESTRARVKSARSEVTSAEAEIMAAGAALREAQRNVARTEIAAPYAGRVRSQSVDIGQVVNRGSPVAKVYAVDVAEVRMPLAAEQFAYLNLSLDYRPALRVRSPGSRVQSPETLDSGLGTRDSSEASAGGASVLFSAPFAGRRHRWHGRVVRIEGEIDPSTRLVYVVAEVLDPYGSGEGHRAGADPDESDGEAAGAAPPARRPPLAVGMFVDAEIEGREARNVVVLPRSVLRGRDTVLVVEGHGILVRLMLAAPAPEAPRERYLLPVASALGRVDGVQSSTIQSIHGDAIVLTLADRSEPREVLQRVVARLRAPGVVPQGVTRVTARTRNRLAFRTVDVLRTERTSGPEGSRVILRGGLVPGERVSVTALETPVNGMEVTVRGEFHRIDLPQENALPGGPASPGAQPAPATPRSGRATRGEESP